MDISTFLQQLIESARPFLDVLGQAFEPVLGTLDPVLIGRLLWVLVLCGVIGLERSEHERASGFRPHILVGLGACMMTMAGAYALPDITERDPLRVASYVVSGIGFLGGGAILRHGTTVRGMTTAASIWGAAGIGIATGVGMGGLATIAAILILFTLSTLERLEPRLGLGHGVLANELKLHLKDSNRAVGKALTALNRLGVPIRSVNLLPASGDTALMRVELSQPLKPSQVPRLVKQLLVVKSIARVDVSALNIEKTQKTPKPPRVIRDHRATQPIEQLNLDDDYLLKDLNEPEANENDSNPPAEGLPA